MKKNNNQQIDKIIDNGLKKEELSNKYGAHFSGGEDISPDLESEFLKSIEEYHEQYENSLRVSIYDYLGKPDFIKVEDLKTDNLHGELERMYSILNDANIGLDTLSEVDDWEIYRFITEELFYEEIDNIRLPGMMSCFIYEEFHPNAKNDIEQACDYFYRFTLSKLKNIGGNGYDMLYVDTKNFLDAQGRKLEKSRVEDAINNFLDSFDRFDIVKNKLKSLEINEDQNDAVVKFDIHYKGLFEKSSEFVDYKGEVVFKLKPSEYGGWDMYHIDMPGLKIS